MPCEQSHFSQRTPLRLDGETCDDGGDGAGSFVATGAGDELPEDEASDGVRGEMSWARSCSLRLSIVAW